MKHKILWDQR